MMKTQQVRFRVSREQFERLRMNASMKGFKTVSEYLRELSLKNPLVLEQKIASIDKKLELLEIIINTMKLEGKIKVQPALIPTKTPEWFRELQEKGILE